MRKYRIYSGAKPSNANATYAVGWGGKYFAVSPTTGKETVRGPSLGTASSGNIVDLTYSNKSNDSFTTTLTKWYCSNPDFNSGSDQIFNFSEVSDQCLGPNTEATYVWDVSSSLYPGINYISAFVKYAPIGGYQTGTGEARSPQITIYKKFTAPGVTIAGVAFANTIYNSNNKYPYSLSPYYSYDSYTLSIKATNPNGVIASYYTPSQTTRAGTVAANSSATTSRLFSGGRALMSAAPVSSNSTVSVWLDSGSTTSVNSATVSGAGSATRTIPASPQLVSVLPTSATSNSFQVTVKNNNSIKYFCRVQYHDNSSTASDYWVANCPANGTGTMVSTSGSASYFTLTRGKEYIISMYFFTTSSGSLAYSGTQVSRTVHYLIKAPDSGYLYTSPIVLGTVYSNNNTRVTFTIQNNNNLTLYTRLDLYQGTGTSGTRVDYWMCQTNSYTSATCPNSWSVSSKSTYTLRCYFMSTYSYNGTQVSGYTTYTFTTP